MPDTTTTPPPGPAEAAMPGISPLAAAMGEPLDEQAEGMTLRDYFAAKAMGGWMAIDADAPECREDACETIKGQAEVIAEMAYAVADAMLAERRKP